MPDELPGLALAFDEVIGVLVLASLALLVTGLVIQRKVSLRTRIRLAFTPYTMVFVAAVLTLTMQAGTVLWFARRLGVAQEYSRRPQHSAIVFAQAYEVLARTLPWIVITLVAGGLLGWIVTWVAAGRRDGTGRADLDAAWAGTSGPEGWLDAREMADWSRRLRRSRLTPPASLAAARWALWTVALVFTPLLLVYLVLWVREMIRQGWPTGHILLGLGRFHSPMPLSWCSWLLTALPVLAVLLLWYALTKPSVRRTTAIAWDISTFWPRSFHPLAPPSYAERAVPELQNRVRRLLEGQDGRAGSVLLLGHSQGSILVTAALASLTAGRDHPEDADLSQRLAVITYGCPVTRLYASSFPAYFDEDLLHATAMKIHSDRPGWWNAWRYTDYVGAGPVAGTGRAIDNEMLADPPSPWHPRGDSAPPVRAHSERGYRLQRPFVLRSDAEARRLLAGCSPKIPRPQDGAIRR